MFATARYCGRGSPGDDQRSLASINYPPEPHSRASPLQHARRRPCQRSWRGRTPRPTRLSRVVDCALLTRAELVARRRRSSCKTGLPERLTGGWNAGRQEVDFFVKVAAATPPGVFPRCFEAEWNSKRTIGGSFSKTSGVRIQFVTTWPLPPTLSDCETILRAHAQFHAHWWAKYASASRSEAGVTPRPSINFCDGWRARSQSSKTGSAVEPAAGAKGSVPVLLDRARAW